MKNSFIVIADAKHKRGAFHGLDRFYHLDYMYEVSKVPIPPIFPPLPTEVAEYLDHHAAEYDGALICGCCANSLKILTDKSIFPGIVVFYDFSLIRGYENPNGDDPEATIRPTVDYYVKGPQSRVETMTEIDRLLGYHKRRRQDSLIEQPRVLRQPALIEHMLMSPANK